MIRLSNINTWGWDIAMAQLNQKSNTYSDSSLCNKTYIDCMCGCPISPCYNSPGFIIGEHDWELLAQVNNQKEILAGIHVSIDVTAPMYWWAQLNEYGLVSIIDGAIFAQRLLAQPITIEDFSIDIMDNIALSAFQQYIDYIESLRLIYTNGFQQYKQYDERILDSIAQMLPASYNQTKVIKTNYAELRDVYIMALNNSSAEWDEFCATIETLPYADKLICN